MVVYQAVAVGQLDVVRRVPDKKGPNVVRGHLGRMEETEQGSNGRH